MATTNQRNRSGSQKGSSGNQRSESTQGKVGKVAAQARDKAAEMRDDMASYYSQGTERFGELTSGHEGQAVLIALAAGFGVGLVIGCSLAAASGRPQSWTERIMAEGLGRKIMDRVERMMPEAIAEHFGR
jgi:hypothetical protein